MKPVDQQDQPSSLFLALDNHVRSKNSLWVGLGWGLAEATVFFVVPDVYLGLAALVNWRRGLLVTCAALLGAMLGGVLMYTLAALAPQQVTAVLQSIPLISPKMIEHVAAMLSADGLSAFVKGPFSGIPYKLFAAESGAQNIPLLPMLWVTIFARLERFLPATLAAGLIGTRFKGVIRKHTPLVMGAYMLFWAAVYVAYVILVSR